MQFARHETFHFREGWLTKGIKKISMDNMQDIFLRKDAIEHLGIGSNMVKALRYWMQATKLSKEKKIDSKTIQFLTTEFGEVIKQYDRYLEEEMSLWLLHYHLANNRKLATTWYWFFNVFEYKEFDEEIFISQLESWAKQEGVEVAKGSLKKDLDCLINTYLVSKDGKNVSPEDNLGCPLRELRLIEQVDEKKRRYRITKRKVETMPQELFHYCLMDFIYKDNKSNSKTHVTIDELLDTEGSIGRIFSFGLAEIIQVLELLQSNGVIHVTKTAGLNNVTILNIVNPSEILINYYQNQRGTEG